MYVHVLSKVVTDLRSHRFMILNVCACVCNHVCVDVLYNTRLNKNSSAHKLPIVYYKSPAHTTRDNKDIIVDDLLLNE